MALSIEVGLGSGHIVLDGNPAPLPKKRAEPPIFGPFSECSLIAVVSLSVVCLSVTLVHPT